MKKYTFVALMMACSASFAQSSVNVPMPTKGTIQRITITDSTTGETRSLYSPVPGVYVSPPSWMTQTANDVKQEMKKDAENSRQGQEAGVAVLPAPANVAPPVASPMPSVPSAPVQVAKPQPEETKQAKRVGQVNESLPPIVTNDIGLWNKSTISEFEAQGNMRAQREYQMFLMQRK